MYMKFLGSPGGVILSWWWGGGLFRTGGEMTHCCIAHQLPYCLSQSQWQILYCPSIACDDDAPDMLDMSDAESISDGVPTDLLDVEEDVDDEEDAVVLMHKGWWSYDLEFLGPWRGGFIMGGV